MKKIEMEKIIDLQEHLKLMLRTYVIERSESRKNGDLHTADKITAMINCTNDFMKELTQL